MRHVAKVRRLLRVEDPRFELIGPHTPINMDKAGAQIAQYAPEIDEHTVIYLDGHSGLWSPPEDVRCWVGGEWDAQEKRIRGGAFLPMKFDPRDAVSPGVLVIGGCHAGMEDRIEQFFRIVTPGTPVVASSGETDGEDALDLILEYVLKPFTEGRFNPATFSSTIPAYQKKRGWHCMLSR